MQTGWIHISEAQFCERDSEPQLITGICQDVQIKPMFLKIAETKSKKKVG